MINLFSKICSRLVAAKDKIHRRKSIIFKAKKMPIRIKELCRTFKTTYRLSNLTGEEIITTIFSDDNDKVHKGSLFVPYYATDNECSENIKKGASAILTDHTIGTLPCIVSDSPETTLYDINEWLFESIKLPSVIIAGSEGKTTTKRMIRAVLCSEKKVFSQAGNYNTFQALTSSLQLVANDTDIIVQEADEKRPKGIEKCSKILKPDIAVITNIKEAHQQFYKDRDSLIDSFKGITAGMPNDGVVIINGDDPDSIKTFFGRKTIMAAIYNKNADCIAENITESADGMDFDVKFNGETSHIRLSVIGEHNVYNAMMAYIVGRFKGISLKNIQKSLAKYRNSGVRQNICRLGNILVYADCYNASQTTMRYAIKCFDSIKWKGKKAAILGDIGEIEGCEQSTYKAIAEYVQNSEIKAVITYGKDSVLVLSSIYANIQKKHCSDLKELSETIDSLKKDGFTSFLFKASHFVHLENGIKKSFPKHYSKIAFEEKLQNLLLD